MNDVKCKYEVCTCANPHELCPHPLGGSRDDEMNALADRLRVAATTPNSAGNATHFFAMASEALRWRDETRPEQAPPATLEALIDSLPPLHSARDEYARLLVNAPPAAAAAVRIKPCDGKWVYSDNDEMFSGFDHETELSAIDEALDYYCDAETIYVGQIKTFDVRRMIRADYLLENISDCAYDAVGEAAEHWPELSKDQQTELERIIADYILSKSPADFYSAENMRSYTREQAEAMLAAERKGEP